MTPAFDTLELTKELIAGGLSPSLAEAISRAFVRATSSFVTKKDLYLAGLLFWIANVLSMAALFRVLR